MATTAFPLLLAITTLAQGGRESAGLALYHILSLLLFLKLCAHRPFPGSRIDRPLLFFLLVSAASTVYSILTQSRGLIHFATLLVHGLNFYSALSLGGERTHKNFFLSLAGISTLLAAAILVQTAFGSQRWTILPNGNLLAGYLNCGLLAALSRWLAGQEEPLDPSHRFALAGSILLITAALLFLFSAAVTGALLVCLLLLLLIKGRAALKPLLLLAAFVLGASLLFPYLMERSAGKIATLPQNTRFFIWRGAVDAFREKPLFGWGLGSFGQVYQLYKHPIEQDTARFEKSTPFAHNELLEAAVETGGLGIAALLWLLFSISFLALRRLKNPGTGTWTENTAVTVLLSLVLHALFDFNLHLPVLALIFVFSAALLSGKEGDSPFRIGKPLRALAVVWAVIAFLLLLSSFPARLAQVKREKAAGYFRLSLWLNPFSVENIKALAALSDPPERGRLLRRAVRLRPADDAAQAALAALCFSERRWQEAIEHYGRAIRANPSNPFHYAELSEIYLEQNNLSFARALLEQAVRIEPLYSFAHYRLGEIALHLGRKGEAVAAFRNVLKIRDAHPSLPSEYARRLVGFDFSLAERRLQETEP